MKENPDIHTTHLSCETLQSIKFPRLMDGSTAMLVSNLISWAVDNVPLEVQKSFGLCHHSAAGLEKFMDNIEKKIDPSLWVEGDE